MEIRKQFGLIGRNIAYSFSKAYFDEKFRTGHLEGYRYQNFDIAELTGLATILKENPGLAGLNVTIPYKQAVLPLLDSLSETATAIGAVNTIKVNPDGTMTGFNTDYYGFMKSLQPLLQPHHRRALILGTGGASKAVAYALSQLGIGYLFVSRHPSAADMIAYSALSRDIFEQHQIVINCTPLGTAPDTDRCPELPYSCFSSSHIAYDLIYNPVQTLFLEQAGNQGAMTKNGLEMLLLQAEKAWEIWNNGSAVIE